MGVLKLAGCAILNENKEILLLYRPSRDQWELPGGKVEKDEDYLLAAIREVDEELICEVEVNPEPLGGAKFEEDGNEMYYVWFIATPKNNSNIGIKEKDKFTDLRYFSISNLPNNVSPNMKNLSKKILSGEINL